MQRVNEQRPSPPHEKSVMPKRYNCTMVYSKHISIRHIIDEAIATAGQVLQNSLTVNCGYG